MLSMQASQHTAAHVPCRPCARPCRHSSRAAFKRHPAQPLLSATGMQHWASHLRSRQHRRFRAGWLPRSASAGVHAPREAPRTTALQVGEEGGRAGVVDRQVLVRLHVLLSCRQAEHTTRGPAALPRRGTTGRRV
jgi:hypothetical protein